MKKVIDVNYFQNPALEIYLRANKRNKVVLPEAACMESYKGDALKNIYRSMQIISHYPNQVVVLRGSREIIRLQNTSGRSSRRILEDPDQTKGFRGFCAQVRRAVQGDLMLEAQIRKYGEAATRRFNIIRQDSAGFARAIKEIERSFHPEHIKLLRTRKHLPEEACQRIVRSMWVVAASLFRNHPDVRQIPEPSLAHNTYLFRYAIAYYFLALRWISAGGINSVEPNKLRNDMIDMTYVTCATFFDGLLSKDRKMQNIYLDTCYFLHTVFSSQ